MSSELDHLVLARDVAAHGESRWQLDRRVARGELVRVRRGAYVAHDVWQGLAPAARHRMLVHATRWAARDEPVFSHESAAAIHGIPFVGDWPSRAHVTAPIGTASSNAAVIRTRRSLDARAIVADKSGMRTTDPITTALDLASSRSLLSGIVAISHVRQARTLSRAVLEAALDALGLQSGRRRAGIAIARSSDASESPLETLVLARCQDLGFESPVQQFPIVGSDGRTYRVDFAWDDGRIVAESDGQGKYRDPELLAGRSSEEVLWAEKRRENAIRAGCEPLVRLTWRDAWTGEALVAALTHARVPRPRRPRALTR